MKRFLIKVLFAAGFALFVAIVVVAVRVALVQKDVRKSFSIQPGTEVVCIGNSHTGCTFYEAPEFRNRVVWQSSMGFTFHYLRFLEIERLGEFDHGVKVCLVDCDTSSLNRFMKKVIRENVGVMLPMVWRDLDKVPLNIFDMASEILLHISRDYTFHEGVPPEVADWTTRTKEEKWLYLKGFYDPDGILETQWDSDAFHQDWQERFYEMVADMKARCDKRGIRLVFFASPLASDYPDRNDPLVYRRISDVAEKIRSMGIEYYDYRMAYPDNKFYDAGHILLSVSYEFTKKFYAEVLKLPVGK